jgi:hypothetical protein
MTKQAIIQHKTKRYDDKITEENTDKTRHQHSTKHQKTREDNTYDLKEEGPSEGGGNK